MEAFTLLELTLALAVIALLLGTMVLNLSGWAESRRLEEGTRRFETLLCMARADAANLGKRLRLDLGENEEGRAVIQLLWEPDPLGAPQRFVPYDACTWRHHVPTGLVEITRWESSPYETTGSDESDQPSVKGEVFRPVTFYPDGSCDSATIELTSTIPTDRRRTVIEIDGLTGSITRRILTASEVEAKGEE